MIDGAADGQDCPRHELARQRCEDGKSIALLCSNPNLSRRFERWTETLPTDNGGEVIAGTPATLPFGVFRKNKTLSNKHRQRLEKWSELEGSLKLGYLDNAWHPFINETVKDLGQADLFDYLIVDEAQNLCDKVFLELMNALLKDGLVKGCWTMFGDFTYQNIVSPHLTENGKDILETSVSIGRMMCWRPIAGIHMKYRMQLQGWLILNRHLCPAYNHVFKLNTLHPRQSWETCWMIWLFA